MSPIKLIHLSKACLIGALVLLALFATSSVVFTQVGLTGTGPGGVGTNDGTSSLE